MVVKEVATIRQAGEVKHLSTPRKRNQKEILLVAASERGKVKTPSV